MTIVLFVQRLNMEMNNDIVARLRALKNAMDECGFTGISAVTNAAADEIERLRRDYSCICNEMRRMMEERDEARRLLKAVVDMMRDNMAHDATHPHHLCDFIHRPDIGMCKVCEDWTDAMVMCYPDDFQDEEETK
jgi:HAMP domain-containing protein